MISVYAWYLIDNFELKSNKEIAYNEIYSAGGQKTKIILPDSSIVWLNSQTYLRYPSNFNKNRSVYIDGEGYFEITRKENKTFTVSTPSQIRIKVYGTSFNVVAYKNEGIIRATLVKGSIAIEGIKLKGNNDQKEIVLRPNETFSFINKVSEKAEAIKESKPASTTKPLPASSPRLEITKNVNVVPITSWKDGKLVFTNEDFESLAKRLERWYNVSIAIEEPAIRNIKLTGVFEKENINQVMSYLQMLTPFDYEMDLNEIYIYSKDKQGGKMKKP